MNKTHDENEQINLRRENQEEKEIFFEAFSKETDRGLAIAHC
jgi:hypothetical protein